MGIIKLPEASITHFKNHIGEIFDTGQLAEGNWNKKVCEWVRLYTGAPHSIAVNSNGSGLFAVLKILSYHKNKKKIFLQDNTMYGVRTLAISSGMELSGYVECSLSTLMPTFKQVEEFVSKLNKPEEYVFLLTHIGGWVNPDIKEIAELCKSKSISLIEDCAHSLGATLNKYHTGLYGDAGVYSLYSTKAIPVGEGGVIVTKDAELYEIASKFIMYDRFDRNLDIGINLRMSEINALLTYSVMASTESIIKEKYSTANQYIQQCKKYQWNYLDPTVDGQRANLYKFILIADTDDPVVEFQNIKQRTSPVYNYNLSNKNNQITSGHICLPVWYLLSRETIKLVISELKR
jgi:dTDP-4-amino-4,6-dideoxygalactose transaminase